MNNVNTALVVVNVDRETRSDMKRELLPLSLGYDVVEGKFSNEYGKTLADIDVMDTLVVLFEDHVTTETILNYIEEFDVVQYSIVLANKEFKNTTKTFRVVVWDYCHIDEEIVSLAHRALRWVDA